MQVNIEVQPVQPSEVFRKYDRKYLCCCGSVHVKQGAMIIGILSVLSVPIFLGTILVKGDDGERLPLPIELFEVVVQVVVLSLFFYGMRKEKERFLIPYIVYEVISSIKEMVIMANGYRTPALDHPTLKNDRSAYILFMVFMVLVMVALTAWFTTVLVRCYRYITDRNKQRQHTAGIAVSAATV